MLSHSSSLFTRAIRNLSDSPNIDYIKYRVCVCGFNERRNFNCHSWQYVLEYLSNALFFIVCVRVSHIFLYLSLGAFHPIHVARFVWISICIMYVSLLVTLMYGVLTTFRISKVYIFLCFYHIFYDQFGLNYFICQL